MPAGWPHRRLEDVRHRREEDQAARDAHWAAASAGGSSNDFMFEAVAISKEIGEPVKLVWNRKSGHAARGVIVRAAIHNFKAGLDAQGKVVAFRDHFVTFGNGEKAAGSANLNATEFPATFVPNLDLGFSTMPLGVPTGPLRAPQSNAMAYRVPVVHRRAGARRGQGSAAVPAGSAGSAQGAARQQDAVRRAGRLQQRPHGWRAEACR